MILFVITVRNNKIMQNLIKLKNKGKPSPI